VICCVLKNYFSFNFLNIASAPVFSDDEDEDEDEPEQQQQSAVNVNDDTNVNYVQDQDRHFQLWLARRRQEDEDRRIAEQLMQDAKNVIFIDCVGVAVVVVVFGC
jgi:hypothetical protein